MTPMSVFVCPCACVLVMLMCLCIQAMWLMLQQDSAQDYVIATGSSHSVREFVVAAFQQIGVEIMYVNTSL